MYDIMSVREERAGEATGAEAREARLADLMARLTDALARGETPDIEAAARSHPELADELRDLWAAAWIAAEVARTFAPGSSASDETTVGADSTPGAHGTATAATTSTRRFGG